MEADVSMHSPMLAHLIDASTLSVSSPAASTGLEIPTTSASPLDHTQLDPITTSSISNNNATLIDPAFRALIVNLAVRSMEDLTIESPEIVAVRQNLTQYGVFVMELLLAHAAARKRAAKDGEPRKYTSLWESAKVWQGKTKG